MYLEFLIFLAISFQLLNVSAFDDSKSDKSLYKIGVGISDATGPAAGVTMMGYAQMDQVTSGVHMRLFARAFIIDDGINRIVFVSLDAGMISQIVKTEVINRLKEKYSGLYDYENVILSGTHTHSAPAGFFQYALFDITCLGYIQDTFFAMVNGTVKSIEMAHENMQQGNIYVSSGDLLHASINRSPFAYEHNPEEERSKYSHDTDKTMTLMKFVDLQSKPIGMINWFAVHPTSMNKTNTLISGDNKGYASQLFEQKMNPGKLPGKGKFVAAFAQSNLGDVTPNINGPRCIDTGLPCDYETSTCNNRSQTCVASGPGKDMFESTKIIGQRQFDKAWELFKDNATLKLEGPVQFVQQFVDMSNHTFTNEEGEQVKTCPPALGYSFAAGTVDGPGALDFEQGTTKTNPFWNFISNVIAQASDEQIECHKPKPILLDTANLVWPYAWHPTVVETHIGRIGDVLLLAVPGEFTTMSGRRLRNRITKIAKDAGIEKPIPIVAGLSNGYSHYIATEQEYNVQRYEGASTIFGPNTLNGYIHQYEYLATSLFKKTPVPHDLMPINLYDKLLTFLPPVIMDIALHDFGDVINQPAPLVYTGDTQVATFVAGHPRNSLMSDKPFLTIEKKINETTWTVIANDANWETKFLWQEVILGASEAIVKWDISDDVECGFYRIKHFGHHKRISGEIYPYNGVTKEFEVVQRKSTTEPKRKEMKSAAAGPNNIFQRFFSILLR